MTEGFKSTISCYFFWPGTPWSHEHKAMYSDFDFGLTLYVLKHHGESYNISSVSYFLFLKHVICFVKSFLLNVFWTFIFHSGIVIRNIFVRLNDVQWRLNAVFDGSSISDEQSLESIIVIWTRRLTMHCYIFKVSNFY